MATYSAGQNGIIISNSLTVIHNSSAAFSYSYTVPTGRYSMVSIYIRSASTFQVSYSSIITYSSNPPASNYSYTTYDTGFFHLAAGANFSVSCNAHLYNMTQQARIMIIEFRNIL